MTNTSTTTSNINITYTQNYYTNKDEAQIASNYIKTSILWYLMASNINDTITPKKTTSNIIYVGNAEQREALAFVVNNIT